MPGGSAGALSQMSLDAGFKLRVVHDMGKNARIVLKIAGKVHRFALLNLRFARA
jgi:hypothetical protein